MAVLDILGDGSCKALWEFDGSFEDKSGAYGGTPTNVEFTEGVHGQAALFKSSSNYISTTLKTSDFGNTYSIACWFRRDSNDTQDCICGEVNSTINNYGAYVSHQTTGSNELLCGHYKAVSGNFDAVTVSTTVGVWTHLVFARQNGSFHRVYINGVRKGSVACSNATGSSTFSMWIGRDHNTTNRSFDGAIDTFRVFNKALTDEEAMAVYLNDGNYRERKHVLPTPIILSTMPATLSSGFSSGVLG